MSLLPGFAHAEATAATTEQWLSPQKIFALLFLMLGPIKILGPFVSMTGNADAAFRTRLATRSVLFSSAALIVAGVLGHEMLDKFDIPIPVLALTGGLVLFLIALQTVLQQFDGTPRSRADAPPPTLALAINPLAFPTIVTPYGIAATIIFIALAQNDPATKLIISGLILVILVMDWLAMLFAHVILKYIGTALQVFAVVLGVNQIALGLLVILQSLSRIGFFTMQVH
jgi:multiple antibiotic resistance protein